MSKHNENMGSCICSRSTYKSVNIWKGSVEQIHRIMGYVFVFVCESTGVALILHPDLLLHWSHNYCPPSLHSPSEKLTLKQNVGKRWIFKTSSLEKLYFFPSSSFQRWSSSSAEVQQEIIVTCEGAFSLLYTHTHAQWGCNQPQFVMNINGWGLLYSESTRGRKLITQQWIPPKHVLIGVCVMVTGLHCLYSSCNTNQIQLCGLLMWIAPLAALLLSLFRSTDITWSDSTALIWRENFYVLLLSFSTFNLSQFSL